jgi:hypothetical protein
MAWRHTSTLHEGGWSASRPSRLTSTEKKKGTQWTNRARNKALHRVKARNILNTIKRMKANWIGHSLCRNYFQTTLMNERRRRTEVMRRQEWRRTQLLDDLKETRGYCKLKEEALDCTLWWISFGICYGPVARQPTERMQPPNRRLVGTRLPWRFCSWKKSCPDPSVVQRRHTYDTLTVTFRRGNSDRIGTRCEGRVRYPAHNPLTTGRYMKLSVAHWWNDRRSDKPKYSDRILSQCHSVQQKSRSDWPGTEPGHPRREASDQPPMPWQGLF